MNTYYIGGYPVTDELYHHGILGQKWGVRRYQNEDRTLTEAGKKRYAKDLKRLNKTNRRTKKAEIMEAYRNKKAYRAKYGLFANDWSIHATEKKWHRASVKRQQLELSGKRQAQRIEKRYKDVPVSELENIRNQMPEKWKKYL